MSLASRSPAKHQRQKWSTRKSAGNEALEHACQASVKAGTSLGEDQFRAYSREREARVLSGREELPRKVGARSSECLLNDRTPRHLWRAAAGCGFSAFLAREPVSAVRRPCAGPAGAPALALFGPLSGALSGCGGTRTVEKKTNMIAATTISSTQFQRRSRWPTMPDIVVKAAHRGRPQP